ncbi:hypothetical protein D3C81_1656670 [compost metagenome]
MLIVERIHFVQAPYLDDGSQTLQGRDELLHQEEIAVLRFSERTLDAALIDLGADENERIHSTYAGSTPAPFLLSGSNDPTYGSNRLRIAPVL